MGMGVIFEDDKVKTSDSLCQYQDIDEHTIRKVRRIVEYFGDLALKGNWEM
jgi:hypothetical protein